MAAQAIKSAIPSHLKPGNGDAEADFTGKHHGKTRSHMVSLNLLPFAAAHLQPPYNAPFPQLASACLLGASLKMDTTLAAPYHCCLVATSAWLH